MFLHLQDLRSVYQNMLKPVSLPNFIPVSSPFSSLSNFLPQISLSSPISFPFLSQFSRDNCHGAGSFTYYNSNRLCLYLPWRRTRLAPQAQPSFPLRAACEDRGLELDVESRASEVHQEYG
ncbi:ribosomal RNA small subunit methyltransferase A [Striga asiatica]|uniref:Ribosomal RNA small subunit methyltransferase A n=1 Tax=Striga asiatica TaxID=4170 RepID=A0A5A7RDJ3_STRAF|nr:ribosomal RNA small subunit methyltransferase A [Striga asiatica]